MTRRAFSAAVLFVLALSAVSTAAPIRLARQPDYHAGKIAFSYLGDIWVANEDGSNVLRLTDSRGHEMNPRFSPDGRWIAFSSNRYGNNDVFVVAATGGTPKRLTFHTGNDEVVGWTRDSQSVLFRAAHGDGAFPNVATLYQVPVNGGREQALPASSTPRTRASRAARIRSDRRRRHATPASICWTTRRAITRSATSTRTARPTTTT